MMNKQIRDRALEIIKANIGIFMLVGVAYQLIEQIVSSNSILSSVLGALVSALISASSACFYLRAYNKGMPDLKDTYEIFTYTDELNKMFSIMFLLFILNLAGQLLTKLFFFIPIVNLVVVVAVMIVGYLLNLVWYLFVTNPRYPTEYYVKASMKYMGDNLFGYIAFVFGTILLPAIIVAIVSMFVPSLGNLLNIPVNIYVGLATAGYVSTVMIPDQWYSGFARF